MEKPVKGYLEGRNIDKVAAILRSGGLAVLPTDTIYGFHCVYSSRPTIERIRRLKGRSKSAGFILLASSLEMADMLVRKMAGRGEGYPRHSLARSRDRDTSRFREDPGGA